MNDYEYECECELQSNCDWVYKDESEYELNCESEWSYECEYSSVSQFLEINKFRAPTFLAELYRTRSFFFF